MPERFKPKPRRPSPPRDRDKSRARPLPGGRRPSRRSQYIYGRDQLYSVTLVVAGKAGVLSELNGGNSTLSAAGKVVAEALRKLPQAHRAVVDASVIMPNHVHAIIGLKGAPPPPEGADPAAVPGTGFGAVMREFKAATARQIRALGLADFSWQRHHYPHRIRGDVELELLRQHVRTNPASWAYDENNPERVR
jgi:REP element-mobilizing transposase RayT